MRCLCDVCGNPCDRISDWRVMNQAFRAVFQCKNCKRKIRFTIRFKEYYDRVDIKSSSMPFVEKKDINLVPVEGSSEAPVNDTEE